MVKIIDKIRHRRQECELKQDIQVRNGKVLPRFYSFEFFPPKTEAGLDNLLTRIDRMSLRLDPLFVDVTWSRATWKRSIDVASYSQQYAGVDVMLHLTCSGMSKEDVSRVLEEAKSHGIRNILALRGDPPRGKRSWNVGDVSGGDFNRAIDLVKFIREEHGDCFGIAVAGHPEGHPSSESQEQEIDHLKEKLDAGADFVMTQFFYSVPLFLNFVNTCRAKGIDCPILPGIMPIQSYSSLIRMTEFINVSVPNEILDRLTAVKDDDNAVKEIGCEIAAEMCREILETSSSEGGVDGVHFYTLNLERSVMETLIRLGSVNGESMRTAVGRQLPWRPSALESRRKEEIRPINWANRPKSYVMRTEAWDEFPNGRWGDAASPAFGELSELSHFYSFTGGSEDERRSYLGTAPESHEDVFEVFARYVEGRVPNIPWCETPLQPESFLIQPQLAKLNRLGFLTINSQPSVNGLESSDPTFGWGGAGGFVYQKAYCECFTSAERMEDLVSMVKSHPSMRLYAVNNVGEEIDHGTGNSGVTALTWGVFPNREILQPTVFDPSTFLVWAEEAFSLWTSLWSSLYDIDSESFDLIEGIRDSYYLVAIVDNDFTKADGSRLWEAMSETARVPS